MAGRIREEKVLVFKNKRKEKEKHPDYVVMIPTEDEPWSQDEI